MVAGLHNMITYTTKENDVLDWICWKHYGTTSVIEKVLLANPTIADYELPAGTIVNLPYIESIQDKKTEVRLWS